MIKKKDDILISVICPFGRDTHDLMSFVESVDRVLSAHYDQFEILLVGDGVDPTFDCQMTEILTRFPGVRYLRLSRNFGIEIALTAGLDASIGDVCVCLMPDRDPPNLIPEFVRRCLESDSVVIGLRADASKDPLRVRLFRNAFYWVAKRLLGIELHRDTTYFVALSRKAVSQIGRTRDKSRILKLITNVIGLPVQRLRYSFRSDTGKKPYYTFSEAVNLGLDIMVSDSLRPLRFATLGALVISCLNLIYIGYVALVFFFKPRVAEGWVTLSLLAASGFFLLFLVLAVMAEYLGRLIQESRNRPLYYVLDDRTSARSVANEHRVNVLEESREMVW